MRLASLPAGILLASLAATGIAPAQPADGYELAEAYFRKQNFHSAYLTALPLAQRGDARAAYLLALMSQAGTPPIAKDQREAVRWLGRAAQAEHAEAQFALAQAFAVGNGVSADRSLAIAWLERAAENKHTPAMLSLARLRDEGLGMPQDRAAASLLVQNAAELGDAHAQYVLAERLSDGVGFDIDREAAWAWYRKAAAKGEPNALLKLARDIAADEASPPAAIVEAHAFAAIAEQVAEGELKKRAAALKGEVAKRMTPADLAASGERQQALKPKAK
jgi:TPR repeat protein